MANSCSEHYNLLEEKINKIQKQSEKTLKPKDQVIQQQPELRPGLPSLVYDLNLPARQQPLLPSNSSSSLMDLLGVDNPACNRMMLSAPNTSYNSRQNVVGLHKPSRTVAAKSPFQQLMFQQTVTPAGTSATRFTSSNDLNLPSTSTAGSQTQFNNKVANLLGPSPSEFGLQLSSVLQIPTTSNTKGLPNSTSLDFSASHITMRPTSVNSLRKPPSVPVTPVISSPSTAARPVFKPQELRQKLMPTLAKLYRQEPESIPFRQPVDPKTLGIPDYFNIIKKPMDLSTIKRKFDVGQYKEAWEYVDDVWLMFDNAWRYNRKNSRVYHWCTKLSEVFEQEIDPVMQSMGYCCGRKYTFNTQVLCCYGKELCIIPRDAKYYSYQHSLNGYGIESNTYSFCQTCFDDIQGDTVTVSDDATQAQLAIKKDQFKEMTNGYLEMEQFVHCNDCRRKLHQICVFHLDCIWPLGFTCDECHRKKGTERKENKFNAKRLPTNKLGVYIETRVNNFLKRKEAGAGEVHIRVVSSFQKVVQVKPGMRSKFVENGELPSEFPYRTKALFAFEEIDGVDVCFFGMHVQEYGSDCPAPNTRKVYIAYLDSVHFFNPRQLRTAVYYEILLGYLDYVKQLGYTMAHIWACPPSKGDDYIFYCHPLEQKIPKPKRLQDWYKKMLDNGYAQGIFLNHKDILKQAIEDNLRSPADLPYFEGDFWPDVLEEIIIEVDKEEEEKRRKAEAAEAVRNAIASMSWESETGDDDRWKNPKKAKRSHKSKASQRRNSSKKSNIPQAENALSAKMFATMKRHKDVFFVVQLQSAQCAASLGPIQDPDPLINCDFMNGRDAFLRLSRNNHYEFSSLRRAKYSTMAMLYELHNQGPNKVVYMCKKCKEHVEDRYQCTVCLDFALCSQCYEKNGHPHKMMRFCLDLNNGSPPGENRDSQENKKLSIQRCIQSLLHACQCAGASCILPNCQRMKRVVMHIKVCTRKTDGGCTICKQFIALCCYHAKHCQETPCIVPFCANIKYRLKQQQLQQKLLQAQLLRRRVAVMNLQLANAVPGGTASTSGFCSVLVVPGVSSMNTSTIASTGMGMPSHSPPCIEIKPQTAPSNVLQVVKPVQMEAAQQQEPHVGYGKLNSSAGMPGQAMPPSQAQGAVSRLGAGQGDKLLSMEEWQKRYSGGTDQGLGQPGPGQMQQQQAKLGIRPIQGDTPVVRPGASVLNNPANTMIHKQAQSQLMQTLSSPQSSDQKQKLVEIFKTNSERMAAFIKKRQAQAQAQQGADATLAITSPQLLRHLLNHQQTPAQHQNREKMQTTLGQGSGQEPTPGPSGQHMTQQQQRQQQQQFEHNALSEQQYVSILGLKRTQTSMPIPHSVLRPPSGGISMQSLIKSSNPTPGNQPMLSPQELEPFPYNMIISDVLLSQNYSNLYPHTSTSSQSKDGSGVPPMTPQDQLAKIVEQL